MSLWVLTRPSVTDAHPFKADVERLRECIEFWQAAVTPQTATLFYNLLVEPHHAVERITETVEPLIRSTTVSTTLTLTVPHFAAAHDIAIPVLMQERGDLIDGLQLFGPGDDRLSSLSQESAVGFMGAVLRTLIARLGPAADQDYRQNVEPDMIAYLAADSPSSERAQVQRLGQLGALPNSGPHGEAKQLAMGLVAVLRTRYPVIVLLPSPQVPQAAGEDPDIKRLPIRLRVRVAQRQIAKIKAEGGFINNTRDALRRLLGIRPAVVRFPLRNADRCVSYHVQVRGPERAYLARQSLVSPTRELANAPLQYRMRTRYGQRVSHLYVRHGRDYQHRWLENHFFERAPGSVGASTTSALAAAFLVWVAALTRLGYSGAVGTDLVAALLAFPAVIGIWSGFERDGSISGGTLAARTSSLVTVGISMVAAGVYVLGPSTDAGTRSVPLAHRAGSTLWLLIAAVATLNLVAGVGSWLLRALAESHFVTRNGPDTESP